MQAIPMTLRGAEKLREELDFLKSVRRPETVSYTHLDVYKRQLHGVSGSTCNAAMALSASSSAR